MNAKPDDRGSSRLKKQDLFVEDDPAVKEFEKNRGKVGQATNQIRDQSCGLKSEKLAYICEMLTELRKLAIKYNEPMVSYLIEMAILEASTAQSVREFSEDLGRTSKPKL